MPLISEQPRFSSFPLLWLGMCFAVGIAAQGILGAGIAALICSLFIFAIVSLGSITRGPAAVFLCIAFALLGAVTVGFNTAGEDPDRLKLLYDTGEISSGDPLELEGTIVSGIEPTYDGAVFKIDVSGMTSRGHSRTASGIVRLHLLLRNPEAVSDLNSLGLEYGARVRVACAPEREEKYLNPGVASRIELLDLQDIDAVASVKSPLLIEKIADGGSPVAASIFSARHALIEFFRTRFSGPTAGVMIASLLGDKFFLDRDTAHVFREGGTFHVLVISGLHITFIGGLAVLAVGWFTRKKVWQFAFAVSFLWMYTIAVGGEVPVVRASVMFTVLMFSQLVYRKGTLLNALGFCLLILLAWRPQDLFSASFQLTFVSVASIVGLAFPLIEKLRAIGNWSPNTSEPFPPNVSRPLKKFCETLYWREDAWKIESGRNVWTARIFKAPYLKWLGGDLQRGVSYLFEGVLVSLIVQLFLLPLLAVYFHRLSPLSVLLNLWVGVVIAFESFAAAASVVIAVISATAASPVIWITELLNSLLVSVPRAFTESGWASFRLPVYSGAGRAFYFIYAVPAAVMAFAVFNWEPFALKRSKSTRIVILLSACAVCILAAVIAFHPFSSPRPDGRLTVHFLDVGQGDAAFIVFPNGETMLVDGGGRMNFDEGENKFEPDAPRIGEAVVSEFLWEKGYSTIDHIVATHADSDHMQGLADVAANFEIGIVHLARHPKDDPDYGELQAVVARKRIEQRMLAKGDVLRFGEAGIEVLHPDGGLEGISENDSSIVMRLTFGSRAFLLTGDIESAAEWGLTGSGATLSADVVKVPHHGSRTSSTQAFVDSVNAKFAVVPVGNRSVFGHPHPDVIERWKASGAEIIITGRSGTATFSTDGNDLLLDTHVSK